MAGHHIANVDRFAQNEFEYGSIERGRSIFEGLMASYPKRLDLWNVYLDKEVKAGELRAARNLLERLVSLIVTGSKVECMVTLHNAGPSNFVCFLRSAFDKITDREPSCVERSSQVWLE